MDPQMKAKCIQEYETYFRIHHKGAKISRGKVRTEFSPSPMVPYTPQGTPNSTSFERIVSILYQPTRKESRIEPILKQLQITTPMNITIAMCQLNMSRLVLTHLHGKYLSLHETHLQQLAEYYKDINQQAKEK